MALTAPQTEHEYWVSRLYDLAGSEVLSLGERAFVRKVAAELERLDKIQAAVPGDVIGYAVRDPRYGVYLTSRWEKRGGEWATVETWDHGPKAEVFTTPYQALQAYAARAESTPALRIPDIEVAPVKVSVCPEVGHAIFTMHGLVLPEHP